MSLDRSKIMKTGLRALVLSVAMVSLAASARAGSVITFDPTGGGGVNPGVTIVTSQFTYAPGNALAIGAVTPGVGPQVGTTFELKYQAVLGGINGTTLNGGGVSVTGQATDTSPVNGGEIITGGPGGVATGREVTVTADFKERITGVTTVGGQTTLTFGLDPSAPNVVSLYSAVAGTAKNFAGTGFDTGTLILRGTVIQNGLEGSYASTFTTPASGTGSPTSPVAFNQYGADAAAQAFFAGITTTSGTGSTFLPVAVNFTNPSYFPGGSPAFIQLALPSISTADPFNSVEPSRAFFGGTTPNIGRINGFSATDTQFQAQGANDFIPNAVPEPSSIVSALTAFTAIPLFLGFRRRRSMKQAA